MVQCPFVFSSTSMSLLLLRVAVSVHGCGNRLALLQNHRWKVELERSSPDPHLLLSLTSQALVF